MNTIDVQSTATDANIQISKTATVNQLQTDAKLIVTGEGTPVTAIIKADGVKIETPPENVNIIGDASAEIGGATMTDTNDTSDTITENDDPEDIPEPSPSPSPSDSSPTPTSPSPSPSTTTSTVSATSYPPSSPTPSPSTSPSPVKQDISYTAISISTSGEDAVGTQIQAVMLF